jgi:peroxiredoxin
MKHMFRTFMSPLVAIVVAFAATALPAGEYNKVLSIGDEAPSFSGIPGVDGKDHSLDDYKDAKAVVIVFTCNHCPVAVAYEDRIIELQKDYESRGVQVIAISVNNLPADRLDKMIERAEDKGFNFPYIHDESQKSGHAYGAAVTPHFFLLDGDHKIAYMGSYDDNQKADEVEKTYLRDAIDAVLAGEKPDPAETRQFGCGVKYE